MTTFLLLALTVLLLTIDPGAAQAPGPVPQAAGAVPASLALFDRLMTAGKLPQMTVPNMRAEPSPYGNINQCQILADAASAGGKPFALDGSHFRNYQWTTVGTQTVWALAPESCDLTAVTVGYGGWSPEGVTRLDGKNAWRLMQPQDTFAWVVTYGPTKVIYLLYNRHAFWQPTPEGEASAMAWLGEVQAGRADPITPVWAGEPLIAPRTGVSPNPKIK